MSRFAGLLILMGLLSCAADHKRWDPYAYSVVKGDTLYSIAWRYEMDYRDIARWNGIEPPYAIYPGQRLVMRAVNQDGTRNAYERPQVLVESSAGHQHISSSPAPVSSGRQHKAAEKLQVKKNDTLYSIARGQGLSVHQLARWNHLKPPYLLKPGQTLYLRPPTSALGSRTQSIASQGPGPSPGQSSATLSRAVVSPPVKAVALSGQSIVSQALPSRVSEWRWPARGQLVKTFKASDTSRKGIGIRGKLNQTVNAAASGRVVYSGNGLINYGNLVIIKHSHAFLSAYAHNNALLVKEGDQVKLGQAIARMGKQEQGKPQLHFEIRRNGKPVNPLRYLPRG